MSGVPGTRVFYEAPGHGRPWEGEAGYQRIADDLLALADQHGARQALGVSLGANALLRLLSRQPDRFERVVLVLPAALDRPAVRRTPPLEAALAARDREAVEAVVRAELPAALTGAEAYVRARTAFLLASDLGPLLRVLPHDVPVPDPAVLRAVTARVLVLAQERDPLHPADVAREVAAALPRADLVVLPEAGGLLRHREAMLGPIRAHLTGPTG